MLANFFVHQRLSAGGLIGFVVTTTAVAHQINDHVFAELIAIIHRQQGGKHHRIRIVAIDMENRRLNHLRDIGTIFGGTRIIATANGKADLIIEHQMHRATGFIGPGL